MIPRARELRLVYSRGRNVEPLPRITKPADAAALLRDWLGHETVEVCYLLLLNTKHDVIGAHQLSRGTLDRCTVHPRDVFKAAIVANAAALIVAHNHPSGDLTPSPDDTALCYRLRQAGDLIGVDLIDFLIIGCDTRYFSFKEAGR
jgi:DNA repair protein RadC